MDPSRRQFLLKLAKGAAYAAPVVVSMSAPSSLHAQAAVSHKKGGGKMMSGNVVTDFSLAPSPARGPVAPWRIAPPSTRGPGGDR